MSTDAAARAGRWGAGHPGRGEDSPVPLGRIGVSAAFAVGTGPLVFVLGFGLLHAVLAAVAVLAVGIVMGAAPTDPRLEDLGPQERAGLRRDVSELTWMLTAASGRIGPGFHRRLCAVAAARLAVHGVDLDDPAHAPALRSLLGERAAAVLRAPRTELPTEREVGRCLDALEQLDTTPTRRPL